MPDSNFPNFMVSKPTPGGYIVPAMNFGRGGNGPTYTQEQADALSAKFAEEHPFAPPGSFTPNVAPAQPDGPEKSDSGAIDYRTDGQQQALALATGMGSYGGGRATRAAASDGSSENLSPVLSAALGLAQQKENGFTQDTLQQMSRAGVLLSPTDSPEIRANKLAYMTSRLAATYAQQNGGAAPRAPGTPIYTGNLPNGSPGVLALTGGQPAPTSKPFDLTQQPTPTGSATADTNVVDNLVRQAHAQLAKANQPQYFTDPVTGQRFMQYGKTIMKDSAEGTGFPRTVSAAGKTLTEVAPGKFVDEQGNPISWGSKGSPKKSALPGLPGVTVDENGKVELGDAAGSAAAATTNSASPKQATPKAKAFYNHDSVLDEMKRRGINR